MKTKDIQPQFFEVPETKSSYTSIYESLGHLREVFHKSGRFDDSNAKLDEIVKLFSTYIAFKRGEIKTFPSVSDSADKNFIAEIEKAFKRAAQLPSYLNQDGTSIFGKSPALALRKGDEGLAKQLLQLVESAIDAAFTNKDLGKPFDVLNEAFGHFVRDNFRGNIEDAQYMTPPEVVDFAVDLALHDLARETEKKNKADFIVADPSCGVGTFLTAFYHKAKENARFSNRNILLVGQDKVERMVRLSKVNVALFQSSRHQITIGNSLSKPSPIDELNGKVDLIITNPPFGAKFDYFDIKDSGRENAPFFSSISKQNASLDSELLFVDRNLALLKENGLLLIVLPDSVVSASGMPSLLRQYLRQNCVIRAIIELPAVTFAQAGTRTKTVILYLQKQSKAANRPKNVFIAKAEHIGFEVTSRKGVQIKMEDGANDLRTILEAYDVASSQSWEEETKIFSEKPSAVNIAYNEIMESSWTPNHYSAVRLQSLGSIGKAAEVDDLVLDDLVHFDGLKKRKERWQPDSVFISVLHIIGEGMLDIPSLMSYAPTSPGIRVRPGDVLLSKINPRIPRVIVVPNLGERILCSTEFEVMTPKKNVDAYCLSFLLLTHHVQNQIKSLTSGTSASHNRIKTKELAKVRIPFPVTNSRQEKKLRKLVDDYRMSFETLIRETMNIYKIRDRETDWIS